MIQFIRSILPAANRVVLVGIAVLDLLTLGVGVLADVAAQDAISAGFVLALINAKGALFIKGWQQFEKALYTRDIQQQQNDLVLAEQAAAVAAAKEVGGRRATPGINLPR